MFVPLGVYGYGTEHGHRTCRRQDHQFPAVLWLFSKVANTKLIRSWCTKGFGETTAVQINDSFDSLFAIR